MYRWGENATKDMVIKDNGHAMDDMSYFVYTIYYYD